MANNWEHKRMDVVELYEVDEMNELLKPFEMDESVFAKEEQTHLLTKEQNIPWQRRRERNYRYPENRTQLFLQALPFGICGSGEGENEFAGRG
eukprot:scaffold190_cov171-Amphora_coffeaeformis.AAC.25